jgi:hypothetical protein
MSSGATRSASAPPRRGRRSLNALALQLAAVALSFILIALLVVTSSRAAFVAQNENVTNQVTAASVDLTDNDSTTAMFNVTSLIPLTNEDRCIDVTYSGSVNPTAVLLYINAAPTGTLAPYLNLTIDIGTDTADPFRTCTTFVSSATLYSGTLADFATNRSSYATGLSTWDPAGGGETRTFRFRVSVQNDPAAEGLTTTFGFSWETRTS